MTFVPSNPLLGSSDVGAKNYSKSDLKPLSGLRSLTFHLANSGLVGYILSEDPTYITNHNNARAMIGRLDRDELLSELVRHYLFD